MNTIQRDKLGRFMEGVPNPHTTEWNKNISDSLLGDKNPMYGKHHSVEHKKKVSDKMQGIHKGESNPQWKGDKAGYSALHKWVRRNFGTPKKCEWCGLDDKHRMYHWATIDGQGGRDRSNWLRLCVPCHKKYDQQRVK